MSFDSLVNNYRKRLTSNGLTIREEYIDSARNIFLDSFDNNVNWKEVYYKHRNELTYTTIQVHMNQLKSITNTQERISLDDYKKVVFKDFSFVSSVGDLIRYNNEDWIVVGTNIIDLIISCTIQRCNNTLPFYSSNILHSIPCIISSQISLNTTLSADETKNISVLSNEIFVRISANSITNLISINDIFKIGKFNYKILSISDIVESGLYVIKMCFVAEEQTIPTYSIQILNGNSIRADLNTPLQLNIQVNATVNGITTQVLPTPSLIFNSSNDSICTVDENGLCTFYSESVPSWDLTTIIDTEMILDLDEDYELTDDGKFLLNDLFGSDAVPGVVVSVKMASDFSVVSYINIDVYDVPMDNYTVEVSGEQEIIKGYSETFNASKYNNGVLVVGEFTFSIINGSTPTSSYTLSVVDGDTCSVKANSSGYTITLRATDILDTNNYVDKELRLVSLF